MGTFRKKKKVPNYKKKVEKVNSGADVGPTSAREKTQADLWFEAARFRVLDGHRSK